MLPGLDVVASCAPTPSDDPEPSFSGTAPVFYILIAAQMKPARASRDEPRCLSCGSDQVADTKNPNFPFMCLACGSWGDRADAVRRGADEIPRSILN